MPRMTFRVKKKGKTLDRIARDVMKLHKQEATGGFYSEQGLHHSGHSFVTLMAIHEAGIGVTPRPAVSIAYHNIRRDATFIDVSMKGWAKDLGTGGFGNEKALDNIGVGIQQNIGSVFGSGQLPITANPTPLIDTSELLANVARKNTIDKKVKIL